jgi:hypothetical protein
MNRRAVSYKIYIMDLSGHWRENKKIHNTVLSHFLSLENENIYLLQPRASSRNQPIKKLTARILKFCKARKDRKIS